jgi:hypothetical protein
MLLNDSSKNVVKQFCSSTLRVNPHPTDHSSEIFREIPQSLKPRGDEGNQLVLHVNENSGRKTTIPEALEMMEDCNLSDSLTLYERI